LDKTLREVLRVLRPGGTVFCQVPETDYADVVNHVRHFDSGLLEYVFTRIGFHVVSVQKIPYLVGKESRNLFLTARKELKKV